jgi:hypothetical protein
MPSVGSRIVKSHKQHRYVSRRGPFVQPPHPSTARALDIAENEGWPACAMRINMTSVSRPAFFPRSAPIPLLR